MITVKNNLLSFTNQVREWYIHRQHALPPIETLEINSPDNKEEEEELFNSVETNHELDKKEIQILPDLLTKPKVEKETNNNYFNNNEIIKNLPSSFNTTFYYYTAAKTSNFVSHVYDEDWYIRQCLPNKKKKGYWAAKIYLY
ncbi:hypothetical protein BCR36DRAFT_288943 [Piromyces finnis]|uniref:Uncharacterized protein n=1 Tax=Piromyces finnis TaxID=1754191 RepID=A0A1Y1VAP4_9FUNG|nr:hypothetical protein BCR36DRAFT_288943 [Piromyces finnis]|eukprot:ORX51140.1 hypothetical protein BCR36DRAFT_288943 [Piromyces finnis]